MRFFPAPAHLAPQVLGVVVLRTEEATTLPMPAHALAVLTVVLRGELLIAGAAPLGAGALAAGGSATQARPMQATAGLVCASLLCRASLLPRLGAGPADQFLDQAAPVSLFGVDPWETGVWRGDEVPGDACIAQALLDMVQRRLACARAPRGTAEKVSAALAEWPAVRQPWQARLRPPAGWSDRQWQRACRAELGVPPKLLQRLARLHASSQAGPAPMLPWALRALDLGYSDQPHLLREWRLLAGAAPGAAGRDPQFSRAMALSGAQLAPRFFGL